MKEQIIKVETQIPLKGFSTFKVGGYAKYFLSVKNVYELKDAVVFAKDNNLKILCIGGGSNLLIDDNGFDGLVIKMDIMGIKNLDLDGQNMIEVCAGESWDGFVLYAIKNNFFGLENLSWIPGSVGASVVQNIGAYGVEVKDFVECVNVFDIDSLEFKTLSKNDCEFGYRMSIFKKEIGLRYIVVSVTFKLHTDDSVNISYKDLNNYFVDTIYKPNAMEVRSAVINIRKNKFPDLNIYGTAGSFFKNIICRQEEVTDLKDKYPELPMFTHGEGHVKVSTAYILDKVCGLKNFRINNVGLFDKQSLVVVNFGGATSKEIINFVSEIKKIVFKKTKLIIEEEVVIV